MEIEISNAVSYQESENSNTKGEGRSSHFNLLLSF